MFRWEVLPLGENLVFAKQEFGRCGFLQLCHVGGSIANGQDEINRLLNGSSRRWFQTSAVDYNL
jgi:hypothetical protein